jgi:undecaprenyl-diphosphatase
MPGASRNGMTLAAARARGFGREEANALSRHVALPVIVGATALKGTRLTRRGLPAGTSAAFAAGVAASFASTLASTWLIRQVERDRSLAPYAAYRAALALAVLSRLRGASMPDRRFREDVGR